MKTLKSCSFTIKSLDEKNYTVEAIVSTASPDRDGEVILPSSFEKRLDIYRTNPILAWGHPLNAMCDSPGPEKIIGRADEIEVREAGLWCKFRYAVEENETAALCWRMMKNGFLNAFSIGAMLIDYVDSNSSPEKRATLPLEMREKLASGEISRVHTEMELVEVSHVFVGSNRDALISAALDGDEAATKILKSAESGNDLFHRAAILVRSMKMDLHKVLSELADVKKRLDEPVQIEVLDPAPTTKDPDPDPAEQVVPLVSAAGPAILEIAQQLLA